MGRIGDVADLAMVALLGVGGYLVYKWLNGMKTPQLTLPQITLPDITLPQITLPDVTLPDVTLPQINDGEASQGSPGISGVGPDSGGPELHTNDVATYARAERTRHKKLGLVEGGPEPQGIVSVHDVPPTPLGVSLTGYQPSAYTAPVAYATKREQEERWYG